jgi:hypothetical protein
VAKWIVKRAIRHPDRRRPSYRDWETRTQRARYDCSKARKLLGWNPAGAPEELIRKGIQEPAREFFGCDPRTVAEIDSVLVASESMNP